jgi:hypothetical protein
MRNLIHILLIAIFISALLALSATAFHARATTKIDNEEEQQLTEDDIAQATAGKLIYVATTGNDKNAGTITAPLRTIQKAVSLATPGANIYVRGGIYKEAITIKTSGSATAGYIQIQNYPGEKPIIDGTGLTVPASPNGLFLIADKNYILIKGFELRNYHTAAADPTPAGIFITGSSSYIQILNNSIHDIGTNYQGEDGNAFGIAVYGTKAPNSINNIIIDSNQLYNLKLGSSESLSLDGNVEMFQVTNNVIHNNNNIGIDVIGFEGVAPDPAYDQARNGIVAGNKVYNITSFANPAYGGDRSADGIYVDGGLNVIIERNIVYSTDIGVELASEHAGRSTSGVILRNNFIYKNYVVGLSLGGYDPLRGNTTNCEILNNTLFYNDTLFTGTGEIDIQFDIENNIFKNNIVYANKQGILMSNPYNNNIGSSFDDNIYYSTGADGLQWQWNNALYSDFNSYQAATGNDPHSLFIDPKITSLTIPNLHIQSTSPAINAGENLPDIGSVDIDNQPRLQGSNVDIGADETSTP